MYCFINNFFKKAPDPRGPGPSPLKSLSGPPRQRQSPPPGTGREEKGGPAHQMVVDKVAEKRAVGAAGLARGASMGRIISLILQ